jgi:tRNA-modifying protein YgfZ
MDTLDPARAFLTVTGAEAASFLQAIITQDIHTAHEDRLIFSALLSPQGKWMFDFFILKTAAGYQIECRADARDALLKKLALYKLRAKVEIAPLEGWRVGYASPITHHAPRTTAFADPRHPALPQRVWLAPEAPVPDNLLPLNEVNEQRLTLGIPEGGVDATPDETLLDLGYDLLHAVSFTKGCYVGQEVTARMHYKNITRKGFYLVKHAGAALPASVSDITSGGKIIGTLRSRAGALGLMFGRFEEVEQATSPTLKDLPVTLEVPDWQAPKLALFRSQS